MSNNSGPGDASTDGTPSGIQPQMVGDARLHSVGWLEAINGQRLAEPKQYTQSAWAQVNGAEVSFPAPSVVALHLNAAWRSARRAAAVKPSIRWTTVPARFAMFGMGEPAKVAVDESTTGSLFDFMEETFQAVMSSFSALETFCNLTLVERMTAPRPVKTREGMRDMTAEELERNVGTGEKLKRHVPDVLGVASPAGDSVIWGRYRRLNDVRDELTHFKRGNLSTMDSRSVLHAIAFCDPEDFPETATLLLQRFYPTELPRWFSFDWARRTG